MDLQVHLALAQKQILIVFSVFPKVSLWSALDEHSVNTVMISAVDQPWIIYHTDVHNMLTGKSFHFSCFLQRIWLYSFLLVLVRAVTSLASCHPTHKTMFIDSAMSACMRIARQTWLAVAVITCQISSGYCSFLENILHMAQFQLDQEGQQRPLDAQWQFTLQTYGLHRPSRDGFLQVFRAVTSHIGPGMPAILSIPVSTVDSPDRVLDLVEQGWNDLRITGTVVPFQLFPIDSTRAQSSHHRALAYPTYMLVSHEDFAYFEQRPHGLMEVVVPGDSWLLPWRVNWSIMREFITTFCPLGMVVDRLELHLSGMPLTEQLVDCWHGFYARVILTLHGAPAAGHLSPIQLTSLQ